MLRIQKLSLIRQLFIFVLIIFSIATIIFYTRILPIVVDFTEKNIKTYDGIIEPHQIFIIEVAIWFFVILALALGFVLLMGVDIELKNLFLEKLKSRKVNNHFFTDKLSIKQNHTRYIFWLGTLAGLIIHLKFLLFGEPKIEGFDENFFTFLFLVPVVIFSMSFFKLNGLSIEKSSKKIIKRFLIVMIALLLFLFLEEISYGQHWFNWEASGVFKENNFQSETNLHNFANPLYRFIYPTLGMGLFIFLSLFWFYLKKPKTYWFRLLLPHKSLTIVVFYLAASSFIGHNESFEQLLSVFLLLYSYRVFVCVSYPSEIKREGLD